MGLRALALVAGAALLLAAGCGAPEPTRSYSVKGQVDRVVDGGRSLVVDHEEIPGYMEAMQMTFPVQDATRAKALAAGDKIRFELHVSGASAVIGSVEKLPADSPLELGSD